MPIPKLESTASGVYLIVSPSGGRYVGSSAKMSKRWNRYKNMVHSNQHALMSSFKKYGVDNHKFSILFFCEREERLFWERVFGDLYLSLADFPQGLNIQLPGYDDAPPSLSEYARARIREGCKKRWSKPEEREKTSAKAKRVFANQEARDHQRKKANEQWSEEARKRKSEQMKEYFKNPEVISQSRQRSKDFYEKNPDIKIKNYSALANYYKQNPNARSEQKKKYYANNAHPTAKKVIDPETGEIFQTVLKAAERLGIPGQSLSYRIKKGLPPYKLL